MSAQRWFQRRRTGVGWRPAAWQGWVITLAVVGAVVAVVVLLRGSSARIPVVIAIIAAYVVVALATGGSRPGEVRSPGERPIESESDAGVGGDEQREALGTLTAGRSAAGSPDEPALVVEHLTKQFGERLAVDDVSFSVGVGEVFGFLGPNGAGKTTTVRMLATLIAPTSGRARVAGLPLDAANGVEVRKRIAVMTENPGLYLRLTVAENLAFFAGLYELAEPEQRIGQALAAVNLAGRADDPCGSLSKGLRQRVALARTLLSNPAVVFLDEPTSGLDPVASRDVHELIDGLRERGVTVFLTTHRLEEAERLCDRVAILNTSLRTIGRPDELRDRLFTKTLLVRTAAPLASPETVFAVSGVDGWRAGDTTRYELTVSDARIAAPAVTRALVAAGADLLSLAEARHSLEDVYLELIADDPEATR
ncbi:MAG TPA: ABC transporter ATP-binding protein [Gaiellaceae bacterium]|nr:ABC transporter ATP-binding protein [Gaiellaceae bacterium]